MHHAWEHLLTNVAVISVCIFLWISVQEWVLQLSRELGHLLFGLLCGGIAVSVMSFPFEIAPGLTADLRGVTLVLAGFFAGPVAALVAGTMAAGHQLFLGGTGMHASMAAIALLCALGAIAHATTIKRRDFAALVPVAIAAAAMVPLQILLMPAHLQPLMFANAALPQSVLQFFSVWMIGFAVLYETHRRDVARANEIYGAIMDALPDCLNAKDLNGRFLVANPATAALLGAASGKDLIGKTYFDFYPPDIASAFHRDEQLARSSGTPLRLEQQLIQDDGSIAWLSTLKAPFVRGDGSASGIITHSRDVTTRKTIEISLTETQARLNDALTHMADGLAMFDRTGRLVYCNERFISMISSDAPHLASGATIDGMLNAVVRQGLVRIPEGMTEAEWISNELQDIAALRPSDTQLTDGRWIAKRHSAIRDGAWLSVYSEITPHKQAQFALEAANARLQVLANVDGLTGLTNRRAFDDGLKVEFARAQRQNQTLGLLMIDIDHFKGFNDTYGHPEGDNCLRAVAECLMHHARRPSDIAARYGGEEFVALYPNIDQDGLLAVGEAFRQAVRNLAIAHAASPKGIVTVSVGASLMDGSSALTEPADFLRHADQALYQAKGEGRDCLRSRNADPAQIFKQKHATAQS